MVDVDLWDARKVMGAKSVREAMDLGYPRPSGWRFGQWLWNVLHAAFPGEVEPLRGSEVDPYNDSHRAEAFLRVVKAARGEET